MTNPTIRILLVDDHPVVLEGLQVLLKDAPDIEVIGTANSGSNLLQALERYTKEGPVTNLVDIVLMDVRMPEMNGLEATEIIKEKYPGLKVLIMTMFEKEEIVSYAMEKGVDGYISKNKGKMEFIEALRKVYQGEFVTSVDLDKGDNLPINNKIDSLEEIPLLTQKEKQIIRLMADGYGSWEIADLLSLSPLTINTYRKNIFNKLKVI